MKKLLVLVVMLFCSLTVFAQSPRVETQITHDGLGWMIVPKRKVKDSTQIALERAIAKQLLQAKRDSVKVGATQVKRPVVRCSRAQWLRAIFFGGKFPYESDEAYRKRLQIQSYPASQPFK